MCLRKPCCKRPSSRLRPCGHNRGSTAYDTAPTWPFTIGPVTIPMPNFSWRRAAIQRHDLHHMMTGYPFTMGGEFQVATWEFAAGRYPHWGATLLLLPLVAIGMFWSPTAIWRAFVKGRGEKSLYRPDLSDAAVLFSLDALADRMRIPDRPHQLMDIAAFVWLLVQSAAVILAPPVLTGAAILP
jgi:hypothetical protein